jgi:alginate O-acetyltransferase complex protein AlgI
MASRPILSLTSTSSSPTIRRYSSAKSNTIMTPLAASAFLFGGLSQIIPPRWFAGLEASYETAPLQMKVLVPFAVIFVIAIAAPTGMAPFIYFQF